MTSVRTPVTVDLEDLRTVLGAVDWNGDDRALVGAVDRLSDTVALATMQRDDARLEAQSHTIADETEVRS